MANKRSEGQSLISMQIKDGFLRQLDAALIQLNYPDRSSFIRQAIRDKLVSLGYAIEPSAPLAPLRIGKGPPRIQYSRTSIGAPFSLNDDTVKKSDKRQA
jgi:hypothetical protein